MSGQVSLSGKIFRIMGVVLLLFLTGCAGTGTDRNAETGNRKFKFVYDDNAVTDAEWHEADYELRYAKSRRELAIPGLPREAQYLRCNVVSMGDEFVFLDTFAIDGKRVYYLSTSQEPEKFCLLMLSDDLGDNGTVQSFTAGAGELVLGVSHAYDPAEKNYRKYTALGIQKDGSLAWKRELTESLAQEKIWADTPMSGTILGCDRQGNLYLTDQNKGLFVLSKEGKTVFKELFGKESLVSVEAFLSDEGEVLLHVREDQKEEIFRLDDETGQKILLSDHSFTESINWYGMYGNEIVYGTGKTLVKWDVVTGEKKGIVSFEQSGISQRPLAVIFHGNDVSMFCTDDGKQYLLRYTDAQDAGQIQTQGKDEGENLRVINLGEEIPPLKGGLVEFDREEKEIQIRYETMDENEKTRELIDVSIGNGADIYLVSREDFRSLAEKGCLADLSELLGEELLETVLPGAKEMGTAADRLYGLPFAVKDIDTLIINRTFWEKDGWTPDDVLGVLKENSGLRGIFLDVFGMDDAYHALYLWIGRSLAGSSFAEGEHGFESEGFRRILETVKEYSHDTMVPDAFASVKNKEYLGMQMKVNDILTFTVVYKRAGEDAKCIGVPAVDTHGNYLNELGGILVVNAKSAEKKGVKELVRYLFGDEIQLQVEDADQMCSVRYDIPAKYLESGKGAVTEINGRMENGSTYLDEYIAFLKSAVPANALSETLFEMVWEEAEPYFAGDKTLDAVIKVIQSRVNLFRNE